MWLSFGFLTWRLLIHARMLNSCSDVVPAEGGYQAGVIVSPVRAVHLTANVGLPSSRDLGMCIQLFSVRSRGLGANRKEVRMKPSKAQVTCKNGQGRVQSVDGGVDR